MAATRRGALCCLLVCVSGCGYMIGGPYRRDIDTVHVPIFENRSFRRGIEFQLTEAVHKEIQKQTGYRLTKSPSADTRLTGRIVRIDKRVLGESNDDSPRDLQFEIALEVTWVDLRHNRKLIDRRTIDLQPETITLLTHSSFTPETGGSKATARQRAVDNLARQVVQMMQTPW